MKKIQNIVIGLDIGGTNTKFGLVAQEGKILAKSTVSTKGYENINQFIETLHNEINKLIKNLPEKMSIKGIGIGAPNGNIFKGTIENAANLDWKGIIPIGALMQEEFNVPVKVTNDANAAALGEKLFGKGKNISNFMMITLGTGLGGGIIAGNNLLYGYSGFAGEAGHVIVKENGRLCGCGRKGCLETYVSANGLLKTVKEMLSETEEESMLRNVKFDTLTSKNIYEYAKNGDFIALKAFNFTAEILGKALANFTALLSPEKIFLFGGLAEAGDLLVKPTEKYMNNNLLSVCKNTVSIEKSGLKSGDAAILGASALIWQLC